MEAILHFVLFFQPLKPEDNGNDETWLLSVYKVEELCSIIPINHIMFKTQKRNQLSGIWKSTLEHNSHRSIEDVTTSYLQ